MNHIAEHSPEQYENQRNLARDEVASTIKALENHIRQELIINFSHAIKTASWWRKVALKRELEQAIKVKTREAVEVMLCEQGVPKASDESLW
jgi:3-deoxy-D-arabino-heptulosonate 7-phosphate (DAHP) synthase